MTTPHDDDVPSPHATRQAHDAELARLHRTLARERIARSDAEEMAQASIARLNAALTRLKTEHAAMRSLTAAATHDIKNPLTSILGFVQLLQSERLDAAQRIDIGDRLVMATRYTHDLIDGLLEVLRAGAHDDPLTRIDLAALLTDVDADLRARHPGVVVHQRVEGWVLGHPLDTRRLFDNLAENAARYARRDDVEITVDRLASPPDAVIVRFGDNGPGIPPADRGRIFGIFQRGSTHAGSPGTGVGLALAQRIAQSVAGDLWLAREPAPGGGAAFMVKLPAAS